MSHLLNNMSEEEKKSILEQHYIAKHKNSIKITETQLEDIVKQVLNEQSFPGTSSSENMGYRSFSIPPKPKEDINPKKLKLGDGGKLNPKLIPDVKILQQKLIDLDLLKTESGKPTGFFGKLTDLALKTYYSGKVDSSKMSSKETKNDFNTLKVSNQVKAQLKYMKSNGLLSNEKFTILDDKNSQVHAFNPGYSLYKTYYVITGKNRGDQLKTQTMGDWVRANWKNVFSKFFKKMSFQDAANYADSCYFGQEQWRIQNTPSGVFKRANLVENFLNDWIATTFIEKDYGKRFITWQTCEGKTIPFGFHGTENESRVDVLTAKNIEHQSCTKRKMSFGCINFNEKDVQSISDFIDAGQLTIWLPDTTNNIVEIPSGCL